MQQGSHTSSARRINRLVHRHRAVIVSVWIVVATSAASAQQSGSSTTETLTTRRNRDLNGAVTVSEQTVTQRTQASDGDHLVIDTYLPSMEGGRLALSRRVRRVTTATSNRILTIEETEERNPVAPGEPLRLVRRSVTTVHPSGSDAYETERQFFELDVNGRLVPVLTQTEHAFR